MNANDLLFEVQTPLGFSIRVTADRWKLIVTAKHPVMAGRESLVRAALEAPDEVRQSRIDSQVLLFYKAETTRRWTCFSMSVPDRCAITAPDAGPSPPDDSHASSSGREADA